jgi:glycosyltransferase involved in cell wall biosynthesis
MPPVSLHIISIIVGGPPYRDRMRLLYALDAHVEEHVVVTRDDSGEWAGLSHTRVLRPPCRLRGPLFSLWAGLMAAWVVWRSPRVTHWILNEHFWWFASLLPRVLFPRRVTVCVSLYAPNRSLYQQKAWLADPFVGALSKAQCRHYAKRYRHHMLADRIGVRVAHVFIVNSGAIRHDILEIDPRTPVFVLPTSVSVPSSEQPAPSRPASSSVTFLYVGLIEPRKGIGLLLAAFAQHNRRRAGDRLLLIGRCQAVNEEWFAQLMAEHAAGGCVRHLSHMAADELTRQYVECDVFVFPSFHEGSPRVVKEAMVSGCPVVAVDIPGVRLIDPDGRAIQYVPPGDLVALVRCMGELADNPARREELGRLSQAVVADFSHARVAERLAAAYRAMRDGRTASPRAKMP